ARRSAQKQRNHTHFISKPSLQDKGAIIEQQHKDQLCLMMCSQKISNPNTSIYKQKEIGYVYFVLFP
ncbi:hypothetical protein, partial [Pontibacillus marinus]|uniref:hypothetical protein n=1 Tax=Pontibacillus marinus TaxID=273164 RepID=UPI001B7FCC50